MKLCMVDEGNTLIGDIIIDKDGFTFGHKNAWLVETIYVERGNPARKVRDQLYQMAERIALDAGCRLVPSPDMDWEEFNFWRDTDPEALLKVLSHADARRYVEGEGGCPDRLNEQINLLAFTSH